MASTQAPPTHEDISKLAYHLWEERGAPIGSPEVDWERAEHELSATPRSSARPRAEHHG